MTLPPGAPPQAYVVHKPGGLGPVAHAVHIVLVLLTCGLWLPVYIVLVLAAPKVRTEVIVPYGVDPATLAPNPAIAQSAAEWRAANRRAMKVGIGVFGLAALAVGTFILAQVLFAR